jgi:hypothetical protein
MGDDPITHIRKMVVRDYGEPMEIDDNEMLNNYEDFKDELEDTCEIINDCRMDIDFLTASEARIRRGDRTVTFSPHFKFIHMKAPSTVRWYRKKMADKKSRMMNYMRSKIDKFNIKYRNDELTAKLLGIYMRFV